MEHSLVSLGRRLILSFFSNFDVFVVILSAAVAVVLSLSSTEKEALGERSCLSISKFSSKCCFTFPFLQLTLPLSLPPSHTTATSLPTTSISVSTPAVIGFSLSVFF